MAHCFRFMVGGEIKEFTRYEDIPLEFDHIIEFMPEIPEPPYTEEEKREIHEWLPRFNQLMEIERASSSKKR